MHQPEHREHALVIEDERLAEELLGEQDAAREGEREQHEAHRDQPEQEALEREERRNAPPIPARACAGAAGFRAPISTSACIAATRNIA